MILGDIFCSIHDVNVHVNNDVLVQVFIKLCIMQDISRRCLHAREEGTPEIHGQNMLTDLVQKAMRCS